MREMLGGLGVGLGLAVVVIFLLLAANFQSLRLPLAAVSTAPAVDRRRGASMLFVTRTTLTSNRSSARSWPSAWRWPTPSCWSPLPRIVAARPNPPPPRPSTGAASRLRPILMTTCAMIAGMAPMALAIGEAGQQYAPLGRAVIGGLAAGTAATLLVLPAVFALLQERATTRSASLDPDDPDSPQYEASTPGAS